MALHLRRDRTAESNEKTMARISSSEGCSAPVALAGEWSDDMDGGFMRAGQVELSWGADKKKWLVRIRIGEEVIRRQCNAPHDADEQQLRSAAEQTVRDEGYEADPAQISIVR